MIITTIKKFAAALAVIIVLWAVVTSDCFSQVIVTPENQNEINLTARTKQFNEFLNRFNYKTTFTGDPIDSAFKSKMPRSNMINALFDLRDKRADPASKEYSKNYIELKNRFIKDVVGKNLQITRYSGKIIAEAKSRVTYQGSPQNISVFLSQEVVGEGRIKWVILDVKGEVFNFLKTDTTFIRFIPPSSNETDFMNLKRALEDVSYLQYYAEKAYRPDNLTLFFYMVNTGVMKFEYVEQVIYHITDLPGWCIKIKDFNRNELNSGWLISDLTENSLERSAYIETLR